MSQRDKNNYKSVVNASSSANIKIYNDIKKEDATMAGIIEMAERKGRNQGILEGKTEANISTATDMIKDGLPANMIIKYSKLSLEKLQELAKSMNTTLVM